MNLSGVFLDVDSFQPEDLDWQALQHCTNEARFFAATRPQETAHRIHGANVVFSNKVRLDESDIIANPQLKLIVVLATGYNNIDLQAASRAGITVCNIVDYSTTALVEHTASLILALHRQLPAYTQAVKTGAWSRHPHFCLLQPPIRQLRGKTLAIVGLGNSGRGVAAFGKAMGMTVLAAPATKATNAAADIARLPFKELLQCADIISLHCPLTADTHNLIDYQALQRMKNSAFVVNTARGGMVNEADLARALDEGLIAGAGLDVLDSEPPDAENPLFRCTHPNLIITPHNAWGSREARQTLVDQAVNVVNAFRSGRPINRVSV